MPSAEPPLPPVSALASLIRSHQTDKYSHPSHHQNLALQVQHNLQYQHGWTSLCIHTQSPSTSKLLPRPLVSGLPPHRIYVHPDDQIEELKNGVQEGEVDVEREWVLPTHLKEQWTLRRFADIFDAIEEEPPSMNDEDDLSQEDSTIDGSDGTKKRRGGKRLLLATLGDDSTVVYYIVHDGIVKPRQN